MSDPFEFMDHIHRQHELMYAEYARLRQDPPKHVVPGDTILVAAGLIGRGHLWERTKASVLHVIGASIFIEMERRVFDTTPDRTWIDNALIVEVLPKKLHEE